MVIWTIKEGEPLPIEECPGRQMRTGIISEMLADRGHDVTWWTSDFFHQTKKRLRDGETVVELRDNYRLHMLHANTTYNKNISLERIIYSRQLGKAFKEAIQKEEKPDVILCSFPLIDWAYEAVRYAKENDIPIIVDLRDLWPDIIWQRFPDMLQWIAKFLCSRMNRLTDYVVQNADAVLGVTQENMKFAVNHGRRIAPPDEVYYLAYMEKNFSPADKEKALGFWKSKGIEQGDFVICWIGQISLARTDFELVCNVVANMPDCKFVICGEGGSKERLEEQYKAFSNIIFPGFLSQLELEALMSISAAGMIPIRNTPDFENAINNKAIEYMAGSLCVMTSLSGALRELIETEGIGYYFSSEEELRKALEEIKGNSEKLAACKANARRIFEARFDYRTVYGKLIDLIEGWATSDDK